MKKIIFLVIAFFFATSYAMNIERVEYLGASNDGSKIAVFRSHFGPSSNAPFVKVQVLEHNNTTPLFEDGASAMFGDEDTIRKMKEEVLRRAGPEIKGRGIISSKALYLDAITYYFSDQILIEMDARRQDRELQRPPFFGFKSIYHE